MRSLADSKGGTEEAEVQGDRAVEPKTITVVVPLRNEEGNLDVLTERLRAVLEDAGEAYAILFVDDGSQDGTLAKLRRLAQVDRRISAVALSRNFGKEAAIAAGLRHARGDAVVLTDADLQHPPEIIPQFLAAWRAGSEIVFGLRQDRVGESRSRTGLSRLFYRLFKRVSDLKIPDGSTDFLLLDRKAVDAMNALGERSRFSKGLYSWIGFHSTCVRFAVGPRHHGATRWSLLALASYAIDAFASFSSLPLKVWSYFGLLVSLVAIAYAAYFVVQTTVFGVDVPGFPSLIVSIMFFAGVQLISLGVIGEYLARMFEEVKRRPLFIVEERIGAIEPSPQSADHEP
jgi:glycosyltransferase involved in cell wall biosynthesis